MKNTLKSLAIALTLALTTAAAHAQKLDLSSVQVVANTNGDAVGGLFVSDLRDAIAKSPRYHEVYSDPNEGSTGAGINHPMVIDLLTIDPSFNNTGNSTAISEVILWNGLMMDHHIRIVTGTEKLRESAQQALSDVDAIVQQVRKIEANR